VNKRHRLCSLCNRKRLDDQGSGRKNKIRSIIGISNKTKQVILDYSQAIKEIDQEREQVCSGCGNPRNLSNSHLISRQKCRDLGRLDLISEKKNIQKHCIINSNIPGAGHKGCHEIWESDHNLRPLMLDYKNNSEYILSIDCLFAKRFLNL
jgi:ribosomal protein S14